MVPARGVALGLLLAAGTAHADALVPAPSPGRLTFGSPGSLHGSVIGEVRAVGMARGERLALWPDRGAGLEESEPSLVAARAGVLLGLGGQPMWLTLVVDLGELTRPAVGGQKAWEHDRLRFASQVVDDLAFDWAIRPALRLTVGRHRVPFSMWRTFDERDLPLGLVPDVVDRRVPDRRTGLTISGDLGALAYATGVYEDLDVAEPRHPDEDAPRPDGLLALAALQWTPLAPMHGSNPPGKVVGALGPLPTPRSDPWFDTARVEVNVGLLARIELDGDMTSQANFGLTYTWAWLSLRGEVFGGSNKLGSDGELVVTPADWLSLHGRVEWDAGLAGGTLTLGGGFAWHATEDRRSRIAALGWVRKSADRELLEDAIVVCLQAAL